MISAHWSFIRDTVVPKPGAGEVVMTKAWVERGLSLPCSEFFLSVLNTYGLQPHNICPNSYLLLSNFATAKGISESGDVKLWQFFFRVKKETKDKAMLNCGSMTFMLRPGRMYPPTTRTNPSDGTPDGFTRRMCQFRRSMMVSPNSTTSLLKSSQAGVSSVVFPTPIPGEGAWRISPLATLAEENLRTILRVPRQRDTARRFRKTKRRKRSQHPARWHLDLRSVPRPARAGATGEASAKKPKIAKPPPLDSRKAERERLKMLSTAGKHSRPIIPGARKFPEKWDLEQDLLNAMPNNASGETRATSEIQEFKKGVGEFFDKLVRKQKEAEQQKERVEKQLAEKNSELIREKGEYVLKRNADSETIKRQQKELNGLRKYMETAEHHWDLLAKNILATRISRKAPEQISPDDVLSLAGDDRKDLISASRKICHNLSLKRSRTAMDLDRVTGVPPTADVGALLDAVSGYDTRIARRIRHDEFYDKVVLPADEPLEDELQKERDAEARPPESGTWTSSKDAPQEEPKTSAATSDEDEESDEDVSSPAEGAKGKDPEVNASPSKAE
ncbi:hypothetical protein QYE76_061560 [Lolium multiflorum]|uniref:Transposase (putative) gypsy type domain-containing protein n=1 Tax=Lolium multiflorum TaxID=4521 RepID=A0AAD8S3G5_LOLMU|nr:hypothetical protein QYE76_061560 [Lolium multiflorum]